MVLDRLIDCYFGGLEQVSYLIMKHSIKTWTFESNNHFSCDYKKTSKVFERVECDFFSGPLCSYLHGLIVWNHDSCLVMAIKPYQRLGRKAGFHPPWLSGASLSTGCILLPGK